MPAPDPPLCVGVDAGTSRIRALVFTPSGRVVAEGAAVPPVLRPRPGWAEHTADGLWGATCEALQAAVSQLARPERIVSIGIASVGEAFIALDRHGCQTAPVIAWYDERARHEVDELHERLGFEAVTATTGLCPDPIFTLLKLLWMKRHQPDAVARTAQWLNVAHYLAWKLGAAPATDLSLASRTLALDLAKGRWADDLIGAAGFDPRIFPEIRRSGEKVGLVTGDAARASGLPEGTVIGQGAHDHIAGALALDALRPGVLMDSIGTAEALMVAPDRPLAGTRLARSGFSQGLVEVDEGAKSYVLGGLPAAGAAIEWFREAFAQDASYDELIRAAASVRPGSLGATFIPDLRGRLSPETDPRARGALLGLRPEHSRGVVFRAVLEGLSLEARQTRDILCEAAPMSAIKEVRAIGGGTRNPLLLEIKATLYGRPVLASEMSEATALGAALLGGLAAGLHPSFAAAVAGLDLPFRRVLPNANWRHAYERHLADVYRPACRALRALDHKIAELYG